MVKLEITKKTIMRLVVVVLLFLGMLYIAASRHISLGMEYQQVLFNDTHTKYIFYLLLILKKIHIIGIK